MHPLKAPLYINKYARLYYTGSKSLQSNVSKFFFFLSYERRFYLWVCSSTFSLHSPWLSSVSFSSLFSNRSHSSRWGYSHCPQHGRGLFFVICQKTNKKRNRWERQEVIHGEDKMYAVHFIIRGALLYVHEWIPNTSSVDCGSAHFLV